MAKPTQIIRSKDPVSETDANTVFAILIPIVEGSQSEAAVDTAADVISRISLEEDRHLAHVLDWWYVATTGRPSANGGAHRLPKSLDKTLRSHMETLVRLELSIPPAEWLDKRRLFDSMLDGLDDELAKFGTTKPGEREVWLSFRKELDKTIVKLRGRRRATRVEIEPTTVGDELLDRGFDAGSRPFRRMQTRCRRAIESVNKVVDLQREVEPWVPRPQLIPIEFVPMEFTHAVGPLAEHLLRPILAVSAAPSVDPASVAESIDTAARRGDRRGRYKLARIVDAWCEERGVSIESLREEIRRHRTLDSDLSGIEASARVSSNEIDEIRIYVLDDDVDGAEKALAGLREQVERQGRAELARRHYEGLRRKLQDSSLREDSAWNEVVSDIEARLDSDDPRELLRDINAVQTDLSEQLKERFQQALEALRQRLDSLRELDVGDSTISEWTQRIDDIPRRGGGGAKELQQEIEEDIKKFREDRRDAVEKVLRQVDVVLTGEREEFSGEHIGDFEQWHSEIEIQLQDSELTDSQLIKSRDSAVELWAALEDRRIHRWRAEQGEGLLVEHLLDCRGALDFDEADIRRLYVSLKTRPFAILAGLTGSGKSSLTRTFAAAFGADGSNRRFRRIAVRPDWIDQTDVLGFVNPISEQFVPGWLAETIRDCESEPNRLHFVLLDEMNLAPVEQYLAEWLSAIEEARSGSGNVQLPLYSSSLEPTNGDEWPHSLSFPDNLIIIGTVNVDETTRPLSERVLDRANVLLLNVEVSDQHHHQSNGQPPRPWHVGIDEWRKVCRAEPSDDHHEFLVDIADILRRAGIGVGLRAHLELERFVANAKGILDEESALDWGIVQRIIPKIRGFKGQLTESLNELLEELEGVGAPQSAEIVRRWLDDSVSDDEFLEGTDPRLALMRIS